MSFKYYLKSLEKRKIISRKPNPILPFILAIVVYFLYIYSIKSPEIPLFFSIFSLALLIFTIIFAVIHLIVYKILASR